MANPQAQKLVATYAAISEAQMDQVLSLLAASWNAIKGFSSAAMAQWVSQTVPIVEGGQAALAASTDSYVSIMGNLVAGKPMQSPGIPTALVTDPVMRGFATSAVYQRAANTVRYQLSKGTDPVAAMRMGLERAKDMAATDLQLARTHAARYAMAQDPSITGYRRVPDAGACALCVSASGQKYKRGDLMPIHPHCRCSVEPVYSTGSNAGTVDLGPGGEPDSPDKPIVRIHGEIGPILAVKGQNFRGPKDVAA